MSRAVPPRVVGVALSLVVVSLAVGTGASMVSGPADAVSDDVSLSPASGPNGEYARLDDGELVVDLTGANPNLGTGDGLNADGVTTFDDVFVIHYGGERFARVWLTHDSGSVTLRADGRPIQSEANAVVLDANESVAVGLTLDTADADADTDGVLEDITVHASVADPEDVDDTTAGTESSTEERVPNSDPDSDDDRSIRSFSPDDRTRTFTVTNAPAGAPVTLDTDRLVVDGAETRTLTLDALTVTSDAGAMSVDVETVDPESVDAGPGVTPLGALDVEDSGTVTSATFRFSASSAYLDERGMDPGRLVVRRNDGTGWESIDPDSLGMRNGRAVFEADSPGFSTFVVGIGTPAFRVTDASLTRTTAAPGESVPVAVSVTNEGQAAGEWTVPLTVDGDRVANRTVALAPGESTTVRFDVAADSPGEYVIGADGSDAGTLVVEAAPSTATDAPPATPEPTAPAVDSDESTDGTDDTAAPAAVGTPTPVAEPGALQVPTTVGLVGLLIVLIATLLAVRRYGG
ncbi:CARDB domain-containing protein [Haloplanus salilacus]|uniref:CARDB domain-containing protein n=1 Tax=Haloplanus salilacus TaxID=2949994 RepID=UPI0030D1D926